MKTIGIRREDKHEWERRVPLTPEAVKELTAAGMQVVVQPSPIRVYPDDAYAAAGATVAEDLSSCDVVFAVKEIPKALLRQGGAYVFFSHTIKGQPYNMPLLQRLLDLGCTLFDYERIVDEANRRLVFFGVHAGLAGMIDTLHVAGLRLAALGYPNPLSAIRLAREYDDLEAAKAAVAEAGKRLRVQPLPEAFRPFIVGFAGYGNVSKGAQEIFDLLPHDTVTPDELPGLGQSRGAAGDRLYKVVFEERHLAERRDGDPFDKQDYFDHPERYRGIFPRHAAHLAVVVNCIYWTEDYPRLLDKATLKAMFEGPERPRLMTIGDISCDIDGAIASTVKATTPGAPAYVYDTQTGDIRDGVEGDKRMGLAMMTTDCLPCELPREASASFTKALLPFVPGLVGAELDGPFDAASLPEPMRRACIVWRGALTDEYAHLRAHLDA